MAATTTHLMTVEEFRKLPEDEGPVYHELRHGELIEVTRPKAKHYRIQLRLQQLLAKAAPPGALVGMELAFRPAPEHELRVADVAYVSRQRWEEVDPEDNLHGAPELVIEVLSSSNTVTEIYDKEKLCLENGAQEFWVVDPERGQVKVSMPDGRTVTYPPGQEIPLPLFGSAKIPVEAIFG